MGTSLERRLDMNLKHKIFAAWIVLLIPIALLLTSTACMKEVEEKSSVSSTVEPNRVSVEQVKQWMDRGDSIVFVDSRKGVSWNSATTKLPGAIRVPPSEVERYLSEVPRDHVIVVYCT
jgi:hypothetical protein